MSGAGRNGNHPPRGRAGLGWGLAVVTFAAVVALIVIAVTRLT